MAARLRVRMKMSLAVETYKDEMAEAVRRLSWPSAPGESVKSCQRRVHAKTRTFLSYGQVRRIWERRWKLIPGFVGDELRRMVEEHEQKLAKQFAAVDAEYSKVWALVHQQGDSDFYSKAAALDRVAPDRGGKGD